MAEKEKKDLGYRIVLYGFQSILRILVYILLAVTLVLLGKNAYMIGYQIVNTAPLSKDNANDVVVSINDDMSVMDIGEMLRKRGVIDEDPFSFMIQELLSESHNKILPGEYVLNSGMSIDEILETLAPSEEEENEENQP